MSKKVRVAIIGLGFGAEFIPIYQAHPSAEMVAICRRGRDRQALPILDLPLPTPPPSGAEWIEAYRRWARGR